MGAIALVILGAVMGAAATGGVQALVAYFDRKRQRRVAARLLYGDIIFAGEASRLMSETGIWSDRLDFDPALETWREVRADFAALTTALEWTKVGSFYANLERTARAIRPNKALSTNDHVVCLSLAAYSEEASTIAAQHLAKNRREEMELVTELRAASEKSASEGVEENQGT